MPKQVQITIDMDEHGVQRKVRIIEREVDRLSRGNRNLAGSLNGLVGGIPILGSLANGYTAAAVAAGVFAKEAVQASLAGIASNRNLESSATSAGVAYAKASQGARQLGQQLAVSNIEAQKTYASLVTLTKNAGLTGQIDSIATEFADVAAAKGLQGGDIAVLVSQLISGQDEALNRLGIKDPSGLYKEYAASVGRVVASLTEEEKTTIRVSAIRKLAAENAGAAADRLNEVDGQVATLSATLENLTQATGDTITGSLEFRDFLKTLNDGLKAISTSADEVRAKLAQGLTPRQIAEQSKSGILSGIADFTTAGATQLFAFSGAAELLGFTPEEIAAATDPAVVHARRVEEATRQIEAQQRREKAQAEKASAIAIQNEKDRAAVAGRKRQEEAHKKELDAAEEQGKRLADIYKRSSDLIGGSASRLLTDNPFVQVFADAIKAGERMREQFGDLGEDVVRRLSDIEQRASSLAQLSLRFDSQLNALGLRQQARSFERGFGGLSGADERGLSVGSARLGAAVEAAALLREADRLEDRLRGGAGTEDASRDALSTLDTIRFTALQTPVTSDGMRKALQAAIDEQILAATSNLDPNAIGNDPALRGAFSERADALRRQAAGQQDRVQAAIRDAAAGAQILTDARERIAKINELRSGARGVDADFALGLADKALLEEVSRLPEGDRGEFRIAARDAALRQAEREARKEQDAQRVVQEEREWRDDLRNLARGQLNALERKNQITVNINERTGALDVRKFAGPANGGDQ